MERYDEGWVARYVEGDLSPAELAEFEAAMTADAELAVSVALYREVKATLQQRLPEDKTKAALEQRLAGLNKEYFAGGGVDSTGLSQVEPAGESRLDATSKSQVDSAGESRLDVAGENEVNVAGKSRVDSARESRLDAAGKSQADSTGLSQVEPAGESQAGARGKTQPSAGTAPVRRMPPMRWLSVAAALVCLAVGVFLLSRPSLDKKLQELGQIEMTGVAERGANTDTLLQQAAVFFNQQKFTQALPLLNQVVAIDTTSQLALFYRGVAAWHTRDLTLARLTLTQVYNNGSLLKNQAAFYMALTYAREDKKIALEWLHQIPASEPEYLKAKALEDAIK